MKPALLFVHGAWHGAWAWDPVRAILHDRGWETSAVDLPTVHAKDPRGLTLADDAEAVATAMRGIGGPVAVIAHSYGGVPATVGADRAEHIVYVAAFALDAGESLLGAVGGEPPSWWSIDGPLVTAGNAAERPRDLFFGDVDAVEAEAAAARLLPQSVRPFEEALPRAVWHEVPSTYVITEQDAVFPVAAQEALAARLGGRTVRVPTSHSPFLSRPELIAGVIEESCVGAGS